MPEPATTPDRLDGLVRAAAQTVPHRIALRDKDTQLSYAELDARISCCAGVVRDRWQAAGSVVALVAALDPAFAVAYYGIVRGGASVAIVNAHLRGENLAHVLRLSGARIAIVTPQMRDRIQEARRWIPELTEVLLTRGGATGSGIAGSECLDDLIAGHPPVESSPPADADDIACIQFTSGTTGPAKGVMLSHRNLVTNARQVAGAHRLDGDAVMLNHLPSFHPMHLNAGVAAMATHVLCASEDGADAIDEANNHGATHFYSLPVRLARLAADPRLPELRLATARTILSGGSALAPAAAEALSAHFGLAVVQGYGLAETSPLTHGDLPEHPTPGSVGPTVEDTECRTVDVDTRRPLPPGERGEVQVRGPQVMLGYLAGVESPIDSEGWLSTGDIGYIGDDGVLFLVDRLKDVFKCDNWLVSPSEVEAVLARHHDVADCAVVDVPDPFRGAVAHAFVVPRSPGTDLGRVLADTNAELAEFEQLHGIDAIDAIPRSPNGKILRRDLRARAQHTPD
ncbi:AMP-dependent synthetase [Kitasatospora phosalacinea]|uniref:AMP-dependent synthetase n=1 Tax=Kitasatospora phosalacinea TaxID=2065 RepID=A0A9W6QDI4_9ACTN|nr:class I adenylate-forming enzyme family protein [Kitasatospora phosalacinea]GLW74455.1 AMP-dependent synthetase [Kitasatospora phosalacinea]